MSGRVDAFGSAGEVLPDAESALGIAQLVLRNGDGTPVEAEVSGDRFRAMVPVRDGENRIVAEATTHDGRSAVAQATLTLRAEGCGELQVEATRGDAPALSISERAIVVVVDGSNSMWGRMGGQPKLAVAQQTLSDALDWIPSEMQLALRAYGHTTPHAQRDCRDSDLLVPFRTGSREDIRRAVGALKPRGQTPLAYALQQARQDLAGVRGERAVVLVTDGIESCGGDPVAAARALQADGVPVHVIGFGLGSAEDEDAPALRAIAAASGGRYVTARSAAELREALAVSVGTPFRVQADGRTVAGGTLGGGDVIRLPAGDYTLRLDSAPPYEVPLQLASRQGTLLRFKRQGGKVFRATRTREIPYQRCETPTLSAEAPADSTLWEEVPDAPAAPDPARLR